jgi:hypothetical protein
MNTRTARPVVEKYRPFNGHGTTFFGSEGWVSVDRSGIHASDPALLKLELKEEERLTQSDNHSRNFLDCIKSRKKTVSPFEAAFQSHIVSHMSDLCIRLKYGIDWDPKTEQITGDNIDARRMLHRTMRAPWKI